MTTQLSVDMDEYPGGSQEMAAEATASSPIVPHRASLSFSLSVPLFGQIR